MISSNRQPSERATKLINSSKEIGYLDALLDFQQFCIAKKMPIAGLYKSFENYQEKLKENENV